MGIKMTTAFDADGNEWQAEDYAKGRGREPLHRKHCPSGVTHQSAYSRERHNKSIKVPAYFLLLKDGEHADNCPHAVEHNVKKLVTPSVGLIESLRNGKYRLRLMMIANGTCALKMLDCENPAHRDTLDAYVRRYFAKDDEQRVRIKPTPRANTDTLTMKHGRRDVGAN